MNPPKRAESGAAKAGPTRTCVGCGQRDDADALVRVVLGPPEPHAQGGAPDSASVAVDLAGGSFGRGAHVHPRTVCLEKAAKGGLSRAFKTNIRVKPDDLAAQIVAGADRRIQGLLLGARRAQQLAIGADAASDAMNRGAACLVVACDAGSVLEKGSIGRIIAEGRAVSWNDKGALGALFGRDEVAVVAVLHASVADEILRARRFADAVSAASGGQNQAKGAGTYSDKAAVAMRTPGGGGDAWRP